MSHSDSARHARRSLLHEAGSLLLSDSTTSAEQLTDRHDLEVLLLAAAELVRGQAEIAQRYTLTRDERRAVVEEAVAMALGIGVADLAAIGAIGVLVDVTGRSDEIVIASALARVMATFDDDELVHAAVALVTGWLTAVARLVDLPAVQLLKIVVALDGDATDIETPAADEAAAEHSHSHRSHSDRSSRDRATCRARPAEHRTESPIPVTLRLQLPQVTERVVELLPALPRRAAAD